MDIGERYLDDGDYKEAVNVFTAAINIKSRDKTAISKLTTAYCGLGNNYFDDGNYKKAVKAFDSALDIKSGDEKVISQLGTAYSDWAQSYISEGKYEEAKKIIAEIKESPAETSAYEIEEYLDAYVLMDNLYSAFNDLDLDDYKAVIKAFNNSVA